ncbi:MAG TPA: hypothetical protein VGX78_19170, partial [Pirellulales bacterium]|nr:hypothetical protein [Pirellulales bacterium]
RDTPIVGRRCDFPPYGYRKHRDPLTTKTCPPQAGAGPPLPAGGGPALRLSHPTATENAKIP